ncbi:YfzA family protein [Bacillus siamensis]|uniref:YfzA family protein n=1 Tax=Bacillus siamensis TaxID=659243 RepID=UPI0005F98E08|nr:YfzA family protein [Bacillus siamensis]
MDKVNKKRPLYKRSWFLTVLAFLVSQLYFNFAELTGWGPKYREMNGFPANIVELDFFQKYLSFYDNPWFNIVTVFLGVYTVIQIITGIKKDIRKVDCGT